MNAKLPETGILDPAGVAAMAKACGLDPGELATIEGGLGRPPTRSELAVFAGLWSEHCSYKSTRKLLATLPKESRRVLAGPGSHAGTVDVGEGWAVAFKIESHNHPSAVEPFQGAATGVGGILRDVVAQGARPCAVMDVLCFGEPASDRARYITEGVVAGIAHYGNAYGVANTGGRTAWDPRYEGNPLVNALAAGLVRHDGLRTARAEGVGNSLLLAGATTGRDGILGAAFASDALGDDSTRARGHVQVGDPFMGRKLMEATLAFGPAQGMIACQDLGAAGLACATHEMAALGGVGFEVDLDSVPLRESGMAAHEILLSESQERFVFVVRAGCEEAALAHFRAAGTHAARIGKVVAGDRVVIRHAGQVVSDLPASLVAGGCPPKDWPRATDFPRPLPYDTIAPLQDLGPDLLGLLAEPGIADTAGIWSRYDQTVGNRTVRGPGQAEAAVLKLPGSKRGFALVTTMDGPACAVDPYLGVQAVLAGALRKLACAGARMIAVTDGLNQGSPRDPVENLRLAETIRGLGDGLRRLDVPVTGGNVSLYNESPRGAVPPTPMVGALGLVEDVGRVPTTRITEGETLFLLAELRDDPVFCRWARRRTGDPCGSPPAVDLDAELDLAAFLLAAVEAGRVRGVKDGGLGGLGVALAKLCLRSGVGVSIELPGRALRRDWLLFGEYPATAWVSVPAGAADDFESDAHDADLAVHRVGRVEGLRMRVHGLIDLPISALRGAFDGKVAP